MKKLLVVLLSVMMVFSMCACGAKEEEQPDAGLPSPITECTQEELVEATGIELAAPPEADNVAYSYITIPDQEPIAQVTFTVIEDDYCYRAQPTAATSIMTGIDEQGLTVAEDIQEAIQSGINIAATLTGMNYEWKSFASVDVQHCEGICAFNEGKEGFIAWLDVAPGILYSLSMDKGCTQDHLMTMANAIFVPAQGNVG